MTSTDRVPLSVLSRAVNTAGPFLSWWLAELRGLLPVGGTGVPELIAWPADGDIVVRRRRRGGSRVALRLGPEGVLRRTLTLPAMAEPHLGAILAHDIDAHTPWTADQAWFGADVTGRDADGREIGVRLLAVARAAALPWLDRLRRQGLVPVELELVGGGDDGDGVIRVPLAIGAAPRASHRRWVRLAAAATAGLVLAGAGPLVVRQRLADLEREVAVVRQEAQIVGRMADAIDRLRAEGGFAERRKRAVPAATVVLEALSRLLPDDVWLTEWRLEEGSVHVIGRAADAAPLLALIESSPHFADAGFRSAVVREDGGGEGFHISAKVVPHAQP